MHSIKQWGWVAWDPCSVACTRAAVPTASHGPPITETAALRRPPHGSLGSLRSVDVNTKTRFWSTRQNGKITNCPTKREMWQRCFDSIGHRSYGKKGYTKYGNISIIIGVFITKIEREGRNLIWNLSTGNVMLWWWVAIDRFYSLWSLSLSRYPTLDWRPALMHCKTSKNPSLVTIDKTFSFC